MSDQEKEIIEYIIKALKEIYSIVTTGLHGYNFTKRIYKEIVNAETALETLKGE